MLIQGNCKNCKKVIGIIQYEDHYFCENCYGEYLCIECYDRGQKSCLRCKNKLTFFNSSDTIQSQKESGLMF